MIKILTRKQWRELTEKVERQQETIQRMRAEVNALRREAEVARRSKEEQQTRQRIGALERKVIDMQKAMKKKQKTKTIWQ